MKVFIPGNPDEYDNYKKALSAFNTPYIVSTDINDIISCNALLLPGGGDIDPNLFGQFDEGSRNVDIKMDLLSLSAISYAVREKMAILGICKGIQLINVFFGGTIIQHLPTANIHEYIGYDQTHITNCALIQIPNHPYNHTNVLNDLYGNKFTVNSAHHQGIGKLGIGLIPVQFSEDNVIEGLVHKYLPIVGVQWHPERMGFEHKRDDTVNGELLFNWFCNQFNSNTKPTQP